MKLQRFSTSNTIWLLAIGYMAFYAPYAGMLKSLSSGLFLSVPDGIPRFTILPITTLATVILVTILISAMGWWHYLPRRKLFGVSVPVPRPLCIVSGFGNAAIIVTTTLAYTFHGISIVFSLLLMRGGVLVMAPIVDWTASREVHWWSWMGLVLSLLAVSVALADQSSYVLSMAAIINLLAYLGGYCLRLEAMSRLAKSQEPSVARRFFVEEQVASLTILLIVPMALAIVGWNDMMLDLRAGYVGLFSAAHSGPTWIIGLLYGCLFMFGSLIYLDSRENTFCIPINRCMSVIAGLIATAMLAVLFDQQGISQSQLVATFIIVIALSFLAVPSLLEARRLVAIKRWLRTTNILFVCDGNTSRSPIGEALCRAQFAKQLGLDPTEIQAQIGHITSVGLSAKNGAPLSTSSAAALATLNIPAFDHGARLINTKIVDDAEWIFCMTEHQRLALTESFPSATRKVLRLNADSDILNPAGGGIEIYIEAAQQIADAVECRVRELLTLRMPEEAIADFGIST